MPSALDRAIHAIHTADREAEARARADRIGAPSRLVVCLAYLVAVVSVAPHGFATALLLAVHPLALCILEGPPAGRLLRRTAPFLAIALVLGLPSVFLDRAPAFAVHGVVVTRGMLLAATLALKGVLCIVATAQLAAVCGLERLIGAFRAFGLPGRAATLLLLSARYLLLLLGETSRMNAAYALRAPKRRGIAFRDWGAFAGNLLLRSFDRAETVHDAMLLRGYRDADPVLPPPPRFSRASFAYLLFWLPLFLALRLLPL